MEIRITSGDVVKEITTKEFNVAEINKIKKIKGGALRQKSKAPTFSFDLRRYLPRPDEQPGLAHGEGTSY